MTDAGISALAAIGGFELAAGSKPRALAITLEGKLATSGDSAIFGDGNGNTVSGTANGQTSTVTLGAGSVTLNAPASGVMTGTWVLGPTPDASAEIDIIMADGDIALQQSTNGVGSAFSPLKSVAITGASAGGNKPIFNAANHGFVVNDVVRVTGASNGNHNAVHVIDQVSDANTFRGSATIAGSASTTATAVHKVMSGGVCITTINGNIVSFIAFASDEGGDGDISTGDSYRLNLKAYARGGV